ncbi:MAG: polymer-forming cytoskeletal protein, partial [Desulfobacteraceae bacterium]|nr:polymer-forming cytoskeletal protein [Desulfobacteraceae bacterium]
IKSRLFSKFGFKPKPEDIRLLGSERYFEPYLIIGGKYTIDYCKQHTFKVNVNGKTTKVFVAGQGFTSEHSDQNATNKVIRITGEEYAHYERQAYFILDRIKREIPPEKLPISPFDAQKDSSDHNSYFKSIQIPDETQIEFLKTKIANRPTDAAEIIKEIFDITERTIAYYPMYQLTFENAKNQKDATVTINGITGEIILNGTRKIAIKTIVTFPECTDTLAVKIATHQDRGKPILNIDPQDETNSPRNVPEENKESTPPAPEEEVTFDIPAEIPDEILAKGDKKSNEITTIGDAEVPSGSIINKSLQIRGNLRIGDNCKIHGKIEASKDVTIGANTVIDGNLISGGNVDVGSSSLVTGSLQASGYIKINEHACVEGGLSSSPTSKTSSGIQLEVVEVEELR